MLHASGQHWKTIEYDDAVESTPHPLHTIHSILGMELACDVHAITMAAAAAAGSVVVNDCSLQELANGGPITVHTRVDALQAECGMLQAAIERLEAEKRRRLLTSSGSQAAFDATAGAVLPA